MDFFVLFRFSVVMSIILFVVEISAVVDYHSWVTIFCCKGKFKMYQYKDIRINLKRKDPTNTPDTSPTRSRWIHRPHSDVERLIPTASTFPRRIGESRRRVGSIRECAISAEATAK